MTQQLVNVSSCARLTGEATATSSLFIEATYEARILCCLLILRPSGTVRSRMTTIKRIHVLNDSPLRQPPLFDAM